MSELIPIKDNMSLLRDSETNSIVNVNKSQYNNYMRLKEQTKKEKEKYYDLEKDLLKVKDDIAEIKNLLRNFINESKWYFIKWHE